MQGLTRQNMPGANAATWAYAEPAREAKRRVVVNMLSWERVFEKMDGLMNFKIQLNTKTVFPFYSRNSCEGRSENATCGLQPETAVSTLFSASLQADTDLKEY